MNIARLRPMMALSLAPLVVGCGDGSAPESTESLVAGAKPGGGSGTPTYVPMTFSGSVELTNWAGQRSVMIGCQTNDVGYDFSAQGSLNPGESFTFTIMPTCAGWNEDPMIATQLTWDASQIELSTELPSFGSSASKNDIGLPLVARPAGNESHLCMLIDPSDSATDQGHPHRQPLAGQSGALCRRKADRHLLLAVRQLLLHTAQRDAHPQGSGLRRGR